MADLSTPTNDGQSGQTAESLITQNIDIWTTAIEQKSSAGRGSSNKFSLYGIKKLRELILELAVRGKLVPQDANDEPASVLLERIAAEKAQLVKEGILKKPKALPEIGEDEKQFELPVGWVLSRLGSIGNIFNGNSVNARLKEDKYTGLSEGLPFIATKDVGYGFETLDYKNGVLIPFDEPKFKVAQKNSVLICAEGGSAGRKCGIAQQDICFGNKLFAIQLYGGLEPKFVLSTYLTPMFFRQFSESMTGIIGGISAAKFSEMLIALPPLKEQHRIVAKVDELMSLCDALESQTEASISAHQTLVETLLNALLLPQATTNATSQFDVSLETLLKSCTKHVEPSPEPSFENSFVKDWKRVAEHFDTLFTTIASIDTLKQTILQLAVMGKLVPWGEDLSAGELKEYLSFGPRNGFSPKETSSTTDVRVLKLGATTYGYLDLNQTKFVDIKVEGNSHLWLRDGDILIQRGNSANYVGCNCLIKMDVAGVIYPDLMMKLRTVKDLNPEFLSIWLSSPMSRQFMWDRMTGTSGTMPKISKKIVESIPVIIPSITVQAFIVAKVEELMALCDHLKARLADAQTTQLHLTDAIVEQAAP